jgi:hypothetical protein
MQSQSRAGLCHLCQLQRQASVSIVHDFLFTEKESIAAAHQRLDEADLRHVSNTATASRRKVSPPYAEQRACADSVMETRAGWAARRILAGSVAGKCCNSASAVLALRNGREQKLAQIERRRSWGIGDLRMRSRLGVVPALGEGTHIVDHVPEAARILERELQDDGQQAIGHERNSDKLERIERDYLRDSPCDHSPARPWRHDGGYNLARSLNGLSSQRLAKRQDADGSDSRQLDW